MNVSRRATGRSRAAARPRTARALRPTRGSSTTCSAPASTALARGFEQLEVRGLGQHERAVGVGDVARQLGAAPGRVDADDGRAGERGAAQREPELGDVVEQHADVERRVGRRVRPEERGALRGGLDDLAPTSTTRPRTAARRSCRRRGRARGLRSSPSPLILLQAVARTRASERSGLRPHAVTEIGDRIAKLGLAGLRDRGAGVEAGREHLGAGARRARDRARRRTTRPSRCRRASSRPRPARRPSSRPRAVNASINIRPHVPSYPCWLLLSSRSTRESVANGSGTGCASYWIQSTSLTTIQPPGFAAAIIASSTASALREMLQHRAGVDEVELVVPIGSLVTSTRRTSMTPALGGWKRVSTSSDTHPTRRPDLLGHPGRDRARARTDVAAVPARRDADVGQRRGGCGRRRRGRACGAGPARAGPDRVRR